MRGPSWATLILPRVAFDYQQYCLVKHNTASS